MKKLNFKLSRLNGEYKYTIRHSIKSDYEIFTDVWDTTYLLFKISTEKGEIKISYEIEPSKQKEKGERTGSIVDFDHQRKNAKILLNAPILLKTDEVVRPAIKFTLSLTDRSIFWY